MLRSVRALSTEHLGYGADAGSRGAWPPRRRCERASSSRSVSCSLHVVESTELIAKVRRRLTPIVRRDDRGETRDRVDNRHLMLVLASVLAPDSTAIDIGAHIGDVYREIMRVAPAGRHIAFEPLPDLVARMREAFPAADIRDVALSDQTGEASFIHVLDDPAYSGLRERDYPAPDQRLQTITVRTARLDDEIGDLIPAFVKIDVEGAELQVMQGAAETFARAKPVIWFEHGAGSAEHYGTTPGQVWDLLTDIGLRAYDADARGPLSRDELEESFASGALWNYLAHV